MNLHLFSWSFQFICSTAFHSLSIFFTVWKFDLQRPLDKVSQDPNLSLGPMASGLLFCFSETPCRVEVLTAFLSGLLWRSNKVTDVMLICQLYSSTRKLLPCRRLYWIMHTILFHASMPLLFSLLGMSLRMNCSSSVVPQNFITFITL